MSDQRLLRVSDAEREHVVQLLQRAVGRGLLDIDEFSKRVDVAVAAQVRGELNGVLVDLPGLTHPDRPGHGVPARAAGSAPAPVTESSGTQLRATLGSIERKGVWDVPARLAVQAIMGSVELDFTQARLQDDRVEIDVEVVAGSVELRVPLGSRIDHGGVAVTLGSVEIHRKLRDGGDRPWFVLAGTVRGGSVEFKPPRRR